MATVFEWYSTSFPLALQCFYTAKYNKWRIRRRKWEHATIIAWERSRAGTPAWPSSCSPHGTNPLVAPRRLWPFLSSVVIWFIILVALCRAYYCLCFLWQMCNQKETGQISSTCYTNATPLVTLLPLACFPFCKCRPGWFVCMPGKSAFHVGAREQPALEMSFGRCFRNVARQFSTCPLS